MKGNRNYKILVILIICGFLFTSCRTITTKSDLNITIKKMVEVSKEDGYSDYMYLYLFKKGDVKNELVHFDIDELRRLYFGKHITSISKEFNFEKFVLNIIENKINLECAILGECFMIDRTINNEYQILGFNKFKEKYTHKIISDKKVVLNVKKLEREQILSVIYYFFLNSYFSYWSDYEGRYYSEKILAKDVLETSKNNIFLEEL